MIALPLLNPTARPRRRRVDPSPRILVADDLDVYRRLITQFLDRFGFESISAKDGLEALERWRSESPDLLVLDMDMPKMHGSEVIRKVRALEPADSHVPIIAMTGEPRSNERRAILAMGCDDYFTKPFDPTELIARIGTLLSADNAVL